MNETKTISLSAIAPANQHASQETIPRVNPQPEHTAQSLASTSQSQKTLLCELIHDWLNFFSTHSSNNTTHSVITRLLIKLKQMPGWEHLCDIDPATGQHHLFGFINHHQSTQQCENLRQLLALYLDARSESQKPKT